MPIYNFTCPKCDVEIEMLLPMGERNKTITHSCGTILVRKMSLPQTPIIKKTGNEMALDTLNNGDANYMKPEHKRLAAQGIEKPKKIYY